MSRQEAAPTGARLSVSAYAWFEYIPPGYPCQPIACQQELDLPLLGVQFVPEPVSHQIHGHNHHQDGHAREQGNPP